MASLLVGAVVAAAGARSAPLELRDLREVALPSGLSAASDVRWQGDSSLLLSDPNSGIIALDARTGGTTVVVSQGNRAHEAFRPVRVAARGNDVAFGFALFEVGVLRAATAGGMRKFGFESIQALDLYNGRLAVLGLRRDEDRALAPDGAYAWLVNLDGPAAEPAPLLFARGGAGAPAFDSCLVMEVGKLRFLEDGSLFVIPGAEPGAFRFDPKGKLDRVWNGDEMGLTVPCESMSAVDRELLSANQVPRASWLNGFETLDEILPMADGALALVRSAARGETRWRGVLFERGGGVQGVEVPYRSTSRFAHLRGDVRGERLVLLEYELGDDTLSHSRRLVTARWRLGALPSPAGAPDPARTPRR